jgi:hypothetical protein
MQRQSLLGIESMARLGKCQMDAAQAFYAQVQRELEQHGKHDGESDAANWPRLAEGAAKRAAALTRLWQETAFDARDEAMRIIGEQLAAASKSMLEAWEACAAAVAVPASAATSARRLADVQEPAPPRRRAA